MIEAHRFWRLKCEAAELLPPRCLDGPKRPRWRSSKAPPGRFGRPVADPGPSSRSRIIGDTVTEIEIVTEPMVVKALRVELLA